MAGHGGSRGAKRNWNVGLVLLLGMCFVGGAAQGQEGPTSITVTVNQSRVVPLEQRAKRVSVTQPEIAEVMVVAPNQLLINGKSVGATSLVVWDERGGITNFSLAVMPDIAGLQRQLKALFPEEAIEVSASGPAMILKGSVSNEVVYDKVLEIVQMYLPPTPAKEVAPPVATTQAVNIIANPPRLPTTGTAFAGGGQLAFLEEAALTDADRWGNKRRIPGIIDLLVIKDFRQIQLNVIVAEVSLTKLRELGLDFAVISKNTAFLSRAGSQAGFNGGSLFKDPSTFPPKVTFGDPTSAILSYVTGDIAIATLYRLFQNKDITEILAQPNLLIKNGRSGGFLAGGEFPVPRVTQERFDLEFKPFGVRLDFIPTLTWSNTIDLQVFPEVSEIDESISVQGIPGLKVRRSVSRVEMKEGETLVISGILDRRTLKDLIKFPFLGDIPILGTLFRSTRFRNQETELIFVITPQIVKALPPGQQPNIPSLPKYDDPDIRQVPLSTPPPAPGAASSTATPAPMVPPSEPAPGGGQAVP